MKKKLRACFSLIALLFFSQFSFAEINPQGKYVGAFYQPTGKSIDLKQSSSNATEILVINNTPDAIKVEVPYTGVSEWLSGNRVYRITSIFRFPTTNVRIWHRSFGYMDSFVSNYSIISFSIQYGHAVIIPVEYRC